MRVGLISDTHGHLDPRVLTVFAAEGPLTAILHAGDVGTDPSVLWDLEALAPVTAVLGNCDYAVPGFDLQGLARVTLGGFRILVIHDIADLGATPRADIIVCGHSHIPRVGTSGDALVVNPGSASQRRRQPSRSVAILELTEGQAAEVRIVMLDDVEPAR